MHTKAVFRATQALCEVGFHVLRFNFRGVGTSTGEYGGGTAEEEDVEAALDWLHDRYPELPLLSGGFSFGSRVGITVGLRDTRVEALLGLGLPWSMYDFSFLDGTDKPLFLIQGEHDEFGGGDVAETTIADFEGPITLRVIPGSDHYFDEHFEELQDAVRGYFTDGPGTAPFPEP